jgi:hypothetical protein
VLATFRSVHRAWLIIGLITAVVALTSAPALADGTVPGAPTGVSASSPQSGQALVSFTPADGLATSYTVTASPGGEQATGTMSPMSVGGLNPGSSYTFTVTATNANGTSPASAPSDAVTIRGSSTKPTKVKPGRPSGSGQALTGVAKRHPKLVFGLSAGVAAPNIHVVVVSLPKGLAFRRTRGVTILDTNNRKMRFTTTVFKTAVTFVLRSGQSHVSVTMAGPALSATSKLVAKARRHKAGRLGLSIKVTDTDQRTTKLFSRVAVR